MTTHAFPLHPNQPGMTFEQWQRTMYECAALQGLASDNTYCASIEECVSLACKYADAMMQQREKEESK